MVKVDLVAVEVLSGRLLSCVTRADELPDSCEISVFSDQIEVVRGLGYDFEEALRVLRSELEARGLRLLCNRYRRDALVTSLSRQMSGGLSCYLVVRRQGLDPSQMVECLGPASQYDVVSAEVAERFIASWKEWFERPAIVRWVGRLLSPK